MPSPDLERFPCVIGVVVEFKYDIVGVVGAADDLNFEWSSQVALDVKNLAIEQDEAISIAAVLEDKGLNSLLLSIVECLEVVARVDAVEGVDVVLAAWDGVVAVHVDWDGCIGALPVGGVEAPVWAGAIELHVSCWVVLADRKVMWGPVDADVGFKKAVVRAGAGGYWPGEEVCPEKVFAGDGYESGGILVLDSEGSVDETSAGVLIVNSNGDTLVGDTEHLDDHLIVGDPWSDAEPVGDEEGVVVPGVDVVEGDGVWLGSAPAHAEDLVAVGVVVEVLVLLGVGHQEGEVVALEEWVDTPLVDAVVAVGVGVFEPAVSLAVRVAPGPVVEPLLSDVFYLDGRVSSVRGPQLCVEVIIGEDFEAFTDRKFLIVLLLV